MLKPLKQWFCDRCGDVIEKPEDGWVHWRKDKDYKVYDFEILHHVRASPLDQPKGCYPERMHSDMPLMTMLGPKGLVVLLSFVDVGRYHDPDEEHLMRIANVRNWVETVRRLHVPFYEEARRHFDEAKRDGEVEGINEVALYLEDTLRGLAEHYGES